MVEQSLISVSHPGEPIVLAKLLRGSATEVAAIVANVKDDLEVWLTEHPEDYTALVLLGELNLRIGVKRAARSLLYRATLLKPPSWEAHQRTALLLRRAEEGQATEVERVYGAPPPHWLRRAARALAAPFLPKLIGQPKSQREQLK